MNKALRHTKNKYLYLKEESFKVIFNDAIENSKKKSIYKDIEMSYDSDNSDLTCYYDSHVIIYELIHAYGKVDRKSEEAINKIYNKNFMKRILEQLEKEYQKIKAETIKLIPVVLYQENDNNKWIFKTGIIYDHSYEEVKQIVKMIDVKPKKSFY